MCRRNRRNLFGDDADADVGEVDNNVDVSCSSNLLSTSRSKDSAHRCRSSCIIASTLRVSLTILSDGEASSSIVVGGRIMNLLPP